MYTNERNERTNEQTMNAQNNENNGEWMDVESSDEESFEWSDDKEDAFENREPWSSDESTDELAKAGMQNFRAPIDDVWDHISVLQTIRVVSKQVATKAGDFEKSITECIHRGSDFSKPYTGITPLDVDGDLALLALMTIAQRDLSDKDKQIINDWL